MACPVARPIGGSRGGAVDSPCPIERLLVVADLADAPWLAEAVQAYLDGEKIEAALGLSGPPSGGGVTPRRAYLRRRRDRHLQNAWRSVPGDLGPWQRSIELDKECRRIESLWSGLRRHDEPPANLNPVRAHVFRAKKIGEELPSLRQLPNLCSVID
jgi:hypothetical protein